MSKSKYRIHIENLTPDANWHGRDIECDSFIIMGNHDESVRKIMNNVSVNDIAIWIASDEEMTCAAYVAKAMREAKAIIEGNKPHSYTDLLAGIGVDPDD